MEAGNRVRLRGRRRVPPVYVLNICPQRREKLFRGIWRPAIFAFDTAQGAVDRYELL
jgi:hypothetical protein